MSYIRPSRLGPPRLVRGWNAHRREVNRQNMLVASGDLRSVYLPYSGRTTVGWAQVQTDDNGTLMWAWCSEGNIHSKPWPKRSDRELAFAEMLSR